jgi:hypothetical protein
MVIKLISLSFFSPRATSFFEEAKVEKKKLAALLDFNLDFGFN